MREPSDVAASFSEALARLDARGRFTAADARALRRSLRDQGSLRNVLADPEEILGPFDVLPPAAGRAVVRALNEDGTWRMAAYDLGGWHRAFARTLWRAASKLPYGRVLRPLIEFLAASVQATPYFAVHTAYRGLLSLRSRLARRPGLAEILAAGGIELRALGIRYARGLEQSRSYPGFWHDPGRHATVGLIVGLDFIENEQGYWFIESNMDCGLLPERTAMYQEDPFAQGLLDYAGRHGYRKLTFVSGNSSVEPSMARQLREGARLRKISLELIEDAFHPRFGHSRAVQVPAPVESGVLIVRNRHYRTNIDYVVQHKRASSRALRIYQAESGDSSFLLPSTSTAPPSVGPADPSDPFPNLVFKYPERDHGDGVFFLKVTSEAEARAAIRDAAKTAPAGDVMSRVYSRLDDGEGIFQPYVRTPLLPDRRLYRTRAHVLLTPVGVHFLSAHRIIASKPVPRDLPFGLVRDRDPYVVSFHGNARFDRVPAEQVHRVQRAALGVARGLADAISFGFETGPRSVTRDNGAGELAARAAASGAESR